MTGRLFTAGYGGSTPPALAAALAKCGADLAVDIRYNPWSPVPDYRASRFLALLRDRAGIAEALHQPALGNRAYKSGGMDVPESGIDWLVDQLGGGRSVVIICACRDPAGCHRTHVATRVKDRLPDVEVHELAE